MGVKYRTTQEVIRSGQPRPYADTESVSQITFEMTSYKDQNTFTKHYMSKEAAIDMLKRIRPYGFVENERDSKNPFASYLEYIRPVDPTSAASIIPKGDPNQQVASIWEFKVVTPFTD